jgi:hypothetical protein
MLTDQQPAIDLDALFSAAVEEVESKKKSACLTTDLCRQMSGCGKCLGLMKSQDVGVESVVVYRKTGVVKLTLSAEHGGKPCTIAFQGVPVEVHE